MIEPPLLPLFYAAVVVLLCCRCNGCYCLRASSSSSSAVSSLSLSSVSSSSSAYQHQQPADRLLESISVARQTETIVQLVGVHDALSARIAQQQYTKKFRDGRRTKIQQQQQQVSTTTTKGFGLFVSGFGVAASLLGRPDVSILTRTELETTARNIIQAVSSSSSSVLSFARPTLPPPPVIVDGDTGFGGAANVRETIRRSAALHAAAITIEDQVFPKRCTYMAGQDIAVVSRSDAVQRIRTAKQAQQEAYEQEGNRIAIIARTDCRAACSYEEVVERCLLFNEVEADIVYAENLPTQHEYCQLRQAIGGGDGSCGRDAITPMLIAQFQTMGPQPTKTNTAGYYTTQEIRAMGYDLALYGVTGLQATVTALESVMSELIQDEAEEEEGGGGGDAITTGTGTGTGIITTTPLATLEEIQEVVQFSDLESFEENYGCL